MSVAEASRNNREDESGDESNPARESPQLLGDPMQVYVYPRLATVFIFIMATCLLVIIRFNADPGPALKALLDWTAGALSMLTVVIITQAGLMCRKVHDTVLVVNASANPAPAEASSSPVRLNNTLGVSNAGAARSLGPEAFYYREPRPQQQPQQQQEEVYQQDVPLESDIDIHTDDAGNEGDVEDANTSSTVTPVPPPAVGETSQASVDQMVLVIPRPKIKDVRKSGSAYIKATAL